MPFARQVSIGRVALVNFPEAEAGKLVVISDVVSANAVSVRPGRGSSAIGRNPLMLGPWHLQHAGEQLGQCSREAGTGRRGRPPRKTTG